jgi:hypothetical protein
MQRVRHFCTLRRRKNDAPQLFKEDPTKLLAVHSLGVIDAVYAVAAPTLFVRLYL